jgi:hypothetical protein
MTGFTDVLVIDYTEATAAATTQRFDHTLPANVWLGANMIMRVGKVWANPNGSSALTAEVGHNGLTIDGTNPGADPDYYVDNHAIESATAGAIYGGNSASSTSGVYNGHFITATGASASRIDILITSAAGNLGDATNTLCTSGQLEVYFTTLRDTDFELRQA